MVIPAFHNFNQAIFVVLFSLKKQFSSFQRITSSGKFIPQIDGLRFIAITAVILFHLQLYFSENGVEVLDNSFANFFKLLFIRGYYGVQLFFVISGFILALPFAKSYKGMGNLPELKSYFIRRLTRLEPPYFLVMLLLFLLHVFIVNKYSLQTLVPSLLASLTYTHNIFYTHDTLPLINVVTWSLEIEIQFYILAPFLAHVFKVKSTIWRRLLIIAVMLLFVILQAIHRPTVFSLYYFVQYFLLGFLLVDFFLENSRPVLSGAPAIVAGLVAFSGIWFSYSSENADHFIQIGMNILNLASIFVFYYLVLVSDIWKKIFSARIITVIGGMCYSIYLLHYAIISAFGRFFVIHRISDTPLVDYTLKGALLTLVVLIISAVFFKFVEQPCMDSNWYKKFLRRSDKKQHAGIRSERSANVNY